jgi:hypothetical protein
VVIEINPVLKLLLSDLETVGGFKGFNTCCADMLLITHASLPEDRVTAQHRNELTLIVKVNTYPRFLKLPIIPKRLVISVIQHNLILHGLE